MSLTFTTDTLINSIKIRAQIPTNQVTFSENDFIQLANEEMLIGIVPSIMQLHEDHYLFQEFVPLVGSISDYEIPSRSMGNKLRDLSYVDTEGSIFEMVRIAVEDEPYFQRTTAQSSSSGLRYYYLRGNEVLLSPELTANVTGELKFSYYIRPNQLVKTDRAGLITAINTITGTVTLETFPDNFSLDIEYDFIKGKSPNKVIDYEFTASSLTSTTVSFTEEVEFTGDTVISTSTITNIVGIDDLGVGQTVTGTGIPANTVIVSIDSATQITISNAATASNTAVTVTALVGDLPRTLVIGDYLMQAGETIIPNIPTELHVILAQRVACRCLEALGDTQGLQNANAKLQEMEVRTGILIDNRVEGSPQKIINRGSFLRRSFTWRRF